MTPPLEQPSAVRALYDGAQGSLGAVSDLSREVDAHGLAAHRFARDWMSAPDDCAPSAIRESFARVCLCYSQLGALIDAQRAALTELPARLVLRDDPGREEALTELRRNGVKPA